VTNDLESDLRTALAEHTAGIFADPRLLAGVRKRRRAGSIKRATSATAATVAATAALAWVGLAGSSPTPVHLTNPLGVAVYIKPAAPRPWTSPGLTVLGTPVSIGSVADRAHAQRLEAFVFLARVPAGDVVACGGTTTPGGTVITVDMYGCDGPADQLQKHGEWAPYVGDIPALPGSLDAETDSPESLWVMLVSDRVASGAMYLRDGTMRPGRLIDTGVPGLGEKWFVADGSGRGSGFELRDAAGSILIDSPVNQRGIASKAPANQH
jgi:hypothetical protein